MKQKDITEDNLIAPDNQPLTHQDDNKEPIPPAIQVKLKGKYLIEASAGTGKTWTLTGIILRLLIEAKKQPEHIIATTFTRAAAAEMRERIQARLLEFYQLLQWLKLLRDNPDNHRQLYPKLYLQASDCRLSDTDLANTNLIASKENRKVWLLQKAKQTNIEILEDPINWHLFEYLLDNDTIYPLSDAIRRTALILTTLDKLFVGTLDSLAQKWLSEYSSETGYQKNIKISENQQNIIDNIIHDDIRAFQSQLYHHQPKIYQILQSSGKFTKISDHRSSVNKALNFLNIDIDDIELEPFDINDYQTQLNDFAKQDLSKIKPYFQDEYCETEGIIKSNKIRKHMARIENIHQNIQQHGLYFYEYLNKEDKELLDNLEKCFISNQDGGKVFRKNNEKNRIQFVNLAIIKELNDIHIKTQKFYQYMDNLLHKLNRDIAVSVKQKLPAILGSKQQTTFSLQMAQLNQALLGYQGAELAKYIRHHYPIILVDEAQDMNSEQTKMIESIYFNDKKNAEKGFLLLVGDPKQAIYGFRGGDVANYNYLKRKFNNKHVLSLSVNRRSNMDLIQSLNHWFGCPNKQEDKQTSNNNHELSSLGQDIFYHYIQAHKTDSLLSWHQKNDNNTTKDKGILPNKTLSIINVEYGKDKEEFNEYKVMAKHIQYILNSQQTLEGKKITPNDIVILANKKRQLNEAEIALNQLNIATLKTTEFSVFSGRVAIDLVAVLEAIFFPYRTTMTNRALMSIFYGKSLQDIQQLMLSQDTLDTLQKTKHQYSDYQQYFQDIGRIWQQRGILTAIQHLFMASPILETKGKQYSVWEHLASQTDGERYLIDLRHLIEILAQHTVGMGELQLIDWLKKQIEKQNNEDWAKQRPLGNEFGIQLMTIHKAKGLEFPIVYVLGMDNKKGGQSSDYTLYLYDKESHQSEHWQRGLSPISGQQNYKAIEEKNEFDEFKRLGYVAFTRASEQLFIITKNIYKSKNTDNIPMKDWLQMDKEKRFILPERLTNIVGWITVENIYQQVKELNINNTLENQQTVTENNQKINYLDYYQVMKQQYFRAWSKTSFTALSRQLDEQSQDIAIQEQDFSGIDEVLVNEDLLKNNLLTTNINDAYLSDNIRFTFEKGAGAGSFLHQIFEKINFTDNRYWSDIIDQAIHEYQIPLKYASKKTQERLIYQESSSKNKQDKIDIDDDHHQALKNWVSDVLEVPLLASNQPLKHISQSDRVPELGFNIGLGDKFQPEKINEVFKEYLVDEPDKQIYLMPQKNPYLYRYLRGEIDLVYQYQNKFYIIDYKSNFLGNHISDYSEQALKNAMSKAGYWLQAVIYQIALHRFLKLRLKDYIGNEDKYLGAVEYVFLRGIGCYKDCQQDKESDNGYGRIAWQVPIQLIYELDKIFL